MKMNEMKKFRVTAYFVAEFKADFHFPFTIEMRDKDGNVVEEKDMNEKYLYECNPYFARDYTRVVNAKNAKEAEEKVKQIMEKEKERISNSEITIKDSSGNAVIKCSVDRIYYDCDGVVEVEEDGEGAD